MAVSMGKRSASDWSSTVCEALRTLCGAIEDDRDGARVLFVEITAAGTRGVDCRDRLISRAARALQTTVPSGRGPTELAAEASTAAAWAILSRLVQDQSSEVTAVLPTLALLMLAPASEGEGLGERRVEIVKT
jgi:hypothetical protein